ncbi:hypothetical protein ABHC33_09780 [Ruminococcus bicirculans (ex Wegman et al. 2014)]
MKKIISLFMATIVAAVLPFTCSAANIQNPKYKGVYWDTKNDLAYIDIQTAKCYAIIVYSPVNNKFIKGSTTDFSITDRSFTADFNNAVYVNSSGKVTGRNSAPFTIPGAVDVHSKKIRIKIGNYTYAK